MEIPENNKSSMNTQVPPPPLPPPALNSITPTTGGGGVGPSASGPLRTMVTHHQGVNLTQPLSSSSQSQQTQQQQQSSPPPPPPPPSSVPTSFSPSLSSQRRNFATPFTAPTPPLANNAAVMSQPSQVTTNSDASPPNNSIPSSKSADKVKRRITGQALPSLSGITKKISKDGLTNILPKRSSSPNKQTRQVPPPPPPATQKQNPQKLYEDIPLSPEEFSLEKETDFFLSGHLTKPEPLPSIESGQALLRIQTLASRRAWGDVMHLTGEYLQNSPYSVFEKELVNCDSVIAYDEKDDEGKEEEEDEHKQKLQAETNHLIFYRLYSMLKLRRYADLGREIERFNLVEFQYPYTSPKNNRVKEQGQDDGEEEEDSEAISFLPKWVSFGLKLLAAQSLQYTDKPQRCIDVLHSLEKDLLKNQYKNSAFSRKWLPRIYVAVSNAFLRLQEWRMALSALDKLYDMLSVSTTLYDMLDMEQNNQFFESEEEKEDYNELQSILTNASEIEIRTRQIRIFLQLGGIDQAQQLHESVLQNYEDFQKLYLSFDSLTKQWMNPSSFILVHQIPTHISLNSGLIDFAYGNYQKAMQNFSEALVSMQQAQKKISGYSMDEQKSSYCVHNFLSSSVFLSLDPDIHVMTHCVNNLGLCSLYLNQVDYAISVMETLIKENPTMYLTEVLVFNLCTLYELVYDPDKCTQQKKVLQSVAKRFYLHDVGGENFRIT